MRYFRTTDEAGSRLLVHDGEQAYDLTSADPGLLSFRDLVLAADAEAQSIDAAARDQLDAADIVEADAVNVAGLPLCVDEVWAAGVTYEISEQAREAESGMADVYLAVYEAERPELFFKATGDRVVGPHSRVGIRGDSEWNVPEPELGIVLYHGDIIGYTIGNDMSSRSIEGSNPLYLPQAKLYDRSCALGPCIASPDAVGDPHDLQMSMTITRDGSVVYDDTTSTRNMVRTCEDLVHHLTNHNTLPELTVLLTGTSLVPADEFTLEPGDEIDIDIENIGRLSNTATTV